MIRYFTKTAIFKILPALALAIIFIFSACEGEDVDPNNPYDPNTLPDPHFSYEIMYEKDNEQGPIARITCTNTSAYSNRWEWYFENNQSFKTNDINEKVSVTYSAAANRYVAIKLIAYADIFIDGVQVDTLSAQKIHNVRIEEQQ